MKTINQSKCFDVIILGGGPAGTAAGMTLLKRKGTSVAIVEKSDYSSYRIGESLTPGIRSLLEYLDVWKTFEKEQSLQSFGSQAAWGSDSLQSLDYMFTIHGTGWGLDRVQFDKMLAHSFSERGGNLLTQTQFLGCERTPENTWKVEIKGADNSVEYIYCKYLIDATGRRGLLVRQFGGIRKKHDNLVGVGCVGDIPEGVSLESVTQVEACEYGWWYTSPVPGNQVSVVLMSDADIVSELQASRPSKWRALLKSMPLTSERIEGVTFTKKPKTFLAFSSYLQDVGGENWVAVGDAVASHDPLSSSGVPHAIGSGVHGGLMAANVLFGNGQMLESYQESIYKDFFQYLQTRWKYYQREARWENSLFWKRRRTPIRIAANATLEVVKTSIGQNVYPSTHLPSALLKELHKCCQTGIAAHQVISTFTNKHSQFPDEEVILGLQELMESGYVAFQESLALA